MEKLLLQIVPHIVVHNSSFQEENILEGKAGCVIKNLKQSPSSS